MSAEVLTVFTHHHFNVLMLYVYQLSLSLFKLSGPCNSVRMYRTEGKTEEWAGTGRVRITLSQPAVDTPFCDLFTG